MLTLLKSFIESDQVVPENESLRQQKVEEYQILDTLPEEEFDSLVELAALITGSPVSLMNIIHGERQWTKAATGVSSANKNIPRSESICQYTILENDFFEVQDLSSDDRFKDLKYVQQEPKIRSYCGYPLQTPDGYNIGALCVLDTKPRKLDETQRQALKTLSNEIIARLELRKKQHELEQLNREKDLFLRAVNHDIKSPINGIISTAHYLQNQWDGNREELDEFLSMIELSGRKLVNYTSELMSNILMGDDSKIHPNEVDIAELIKDLVHIYTPLATVKNVKLTLDCNTPGTFSLDDEKFKLILSNLISNALKFCNSGDSIALEARVNYSEELDKRVIHVTVSDSGIGIPDEYLPQIFSGEKNIQRKGTQGEISTGMGLPLVKRFVELHNGDIEVESNEAEGTTFSLSIPEAE